MRHAVLILLPLVASAGCVERTLTVTSDPPGALVEVNGEEFGRTPVTRDFTYYGKFDVALRHPERATVKDQAWVVAPWWQWPPLDFFAELAPWRPRDARALHYDLPAAEPADVAPSAILARADAARELLPATRPGD